MYHLLYIYVHYVARNSCFTVQDDRFEDNIAASNNSVQTLLPRRNCYYKCARDWLGIVEPMVGQYLVSRGIGENDIKRIPSAVIVPLTRGSSNDLSVRRVSINFVAYYTRTQHTEPGTRSIY